MSVHSVNSNNSVEPRLLEKLEKEYFSSVGVVY